MGQPLYSSAVDAGMLGERGYGDGSTLYMWLSSIALLPWLPVFPPQAFPTTISSHIPPVAEYSLEGLMLKLKLQYFGHLMQRTDSLERTLNLGSIEGRRRRE